MTRLHRQSLSIYLAGLALILPLVLYPFAIRSHNETFVSLIGPGPFLDIAARAKLIALIGFSLFGLAAFKLTTHLFFIVPMFGWLLFKTLSAIHPDLAWVGVPEQVDGTLLWVLAVLLPLCFQFEKARMLFFIRSALWGGVGVCFFGLLQLMGWSIGDAAFFKQLVPEIHYEIAWTRTAIASTLYNPNYAGQYFAMLYPLALFVSQRPNAKWFDCALNFLIILGLLGSGNRTSIATALFSTCVSYLRGRGVF